MALNIAASGKFQGNITPLITVEEMDEMVKVNLATTGCQANRLNYIIIQTQEKYLPPLKVY